MLVEHCAQKIFSVTLLKPELHVHFRYLPFNVSGVVES